MKCKNCGADYKASALMCPYCGTKNATGQEWHDEEERARDQKEQTKRFVISSMPLYIINRILNTIIGIGIALLLLLFVALAVYYFIEEQMEKKSYAAASVAAAEEIYQTGDYVKLDDYLTEHQIWYMEESTEYDKYMDVVQFYHGWIRLKDDILRYYDASVEEIETDFEYGEVSYAFEHCQELLSRSTYYYRIDCEENQPIFEEYEDTVKAFLTGEFLLTEEEVEEISSGYMTMDEQNEWVRKIYERKGWEICDID